MRCYLSVETFLAALPISLGVAGDELPEPHDDTVGTDTDGAID
jgi:hypothetical protein